MLILSLFSHDDIFLQMLEINSTTFRHWAHNGEFERLPDDQRWMPDELVPILGDKLRLLEAIMALRKFSLLRYNSSRESISLHPLVQYWTLSRLASDREEQRLKICSIGIVASNFKPEERMPPAASPFAYHDVASVLEEKSLRLWPWRQYHSLAPHAIRCMQQVTTISSMPESVAHLCLCLLQVLDYTYSGTSLERLFSPSAADDKLSLLGHLDSMSWKFDLSFRLSLNIWRVIRGTICPCRKTPRERCYSCILNYRHAASWLQNCDFKDDTPESRAKAVVNSAIRDGTPRIRATALALLFTLNLVPCLISIAELTYELMSENPFSHHELELRLKILDCIPWIHDSSCTGSYMERYVYNMGRYLQVRFWSQYTIKFNHKTCDSDEKYIGEVAQTFYNLSSLAEEYRRSALY